MATTMPQDSTPSLRGARDKYLALLLSAGQPTQNPQQQQQQSQTTSQPPQTSTSGQLSSMNAQWTPGQKFPGVPPTYNSLPSWTSPVTPAPTEGEVRLAEMAAGLVAASGMERRQADTIRQLAGELERSEKRVEQLSRARRDIRDEFEHAIRRSSVDKSKKSIHFLPRSSRRESLARQHDLEDDNNLAPYESDMPLTRRMSERRVSDRRSSGRRLSERRSSARNSMNPREIEKFQELELLKREKNQWVKAQEKSEKEVASLSTMISDIKKNTKRLILERDDHLKVIARLQDEVGDNKGADLRRFSTFDNHITQADLSPISRSRRQSYAQRTDSRRRSMRNFRPPIPVPYDDDRYESASVTSGHLSENPNEAIAEQTRNEFNRERELAKELQLVLQENARLSERIPQLEAHCQDLSTRLEETEKKQELVDEVQNQRKEEVNHDEVLDELCPVLDEMDLLEAVAGAIQFSIDPTEVEQLQETFTRLEIDNTKGTRLMQRKTSEDESEMSAVDKLKKLANRMEKVRNGLAVRYGEWLQAVGNDNESSLVIDTGALDSENAENTELAVSTMNTDVIERIAGENQN